MVQGERADVMHDEPADVRKAVAPEANPQFRKSGFSTHNQNCVEVASLGEDGVVVRNSKRPDDMNVHFTRNEWMAFLRGVKSGEFDD